jgi:hypothetical protein
MHSPRVAVIDTFVKVVEKLIELATYREQRDQRIFKDLVTKLFDDMQIVHTDYLQMLEECARELMREKPLTHLAETLSRHRLQHEALRRRLQETARVLEGSKQLPRYREFFQWFSFYFSVREMSGAHTTSLSSIILGRVEDAIQHGRSMSDQEVGIEPAELNWELFALVHDYLENTRRYWQRLCESYAKLLNSSL